MNLEQPAGPTDLRQGEEDDFVELFARYAEESPRGDDEMRDFLKCRQAGYFPDLPHLRD